MKQYPTPQRSSDYSRWKGFEYKQEARISNQGDTPLLLKGAQFNLTSWQIVAFRDKFELRVSSLRRN